MTERPQAKHKLKEKGQDLAALEEKGKILQHQRREAEKQDPKALEEKSRTLTLKDKSEMLEH